MTGLSGESACAVMSLASVRRESPARGSRASIHEAGSTFSREAFRRLLKCAGEDSWGLRERSEKALSSAMDPV